MQVGKLAGWIIAIGLILIVLYAVFSGLPGDVIDPFQPPR
jgi:hypothetical protein